MAIRTIAVSGAPGVQVDDAIAGADVVVIAAPGAAVADIVGRIGPALAGTTVIDATNNVRAPSANAGAAISAAAPDALYVRAFNTLAVNLVV